MSAKPSSLLHNTSIPYLMLQIAFLLQDYPHSPADSDRYFVQFSETLLDYNQLPRLLTNYPNQLWIPVQIYQPRPDHHSPMAATTPTTQCQENRKSAESPCANRSGSPPPQGLSCIGYENVRCVPSSLQHLEKGRIVLHWSFATGHACVFP